MTPIEIACRHVDGDGINCGAEAGEHCEDHKNGFVMSGVFHAERIEDAAACSSPGTEIPKADFDRMVENSGLV